MAILGKEKGGCAMGDEDWGDYRHIFQFWIGIRLEQDNNHIMTMVAYGSLSG